MTEADKKRHRATADRWEVKAGKLADRANMIGRKVRAAEKEAPRTLAALTRAIACLLGSVARCERVADRHAKAAA